MSRRIRYSVAMSLDGFIAGPKGESDWIVTDADIDFGAIFRQYDTMLLGRRTFEELNSRGNIPMPGMKTLVFSRTLSQSAHPRVTIVAEKAEEAARALREGEGKDIWLFGGGSLFRTLAAAGLVDTVEVAVIPVILGEGIPLLPGPASRIKMTLVAHKLYKKTGIVSLEYAVER